MRALTALLAGAVLLLLPACSSHSGHQADKSSSASHSRTTAPQQPSGGTPSWAKGMKTVTEDKLPPEARRTLELIKKGGPFPYDRDGIVFGNYENQLPKQTRGYYHEYTVPTPGAGNRGARRIITGSHDERYYTDDHYKTFEAVVQ
ncbi:ribonuclease domain-containing protein [Streptomyces sp. NPDC001262]|uniref:ribonuclease domain-containing protein n=1 Tax=Streptomyces TaxID=1883 RepID=UPI0036C78488